jgi:anti-sigma factor RsiW
MECKKVQDRLLTEYADKELRPEENTEVDRHLAACLDCREFFGAVQRSAVIPFQGAGEMRPESAVWQRIQERVEEERARSLNGFGMLADALTPFFKMPQPVFRAAFVTALIALVVVLVKWPANYADPVYGYLSEQMTFMNGLKTGNTDLLNGDLKDYDVVFEEIGG